MQKRMGSITRRVTGTHLGIAVLLLFFAGQCFADDSFNETCADNKNCYNEDEYIYESGQPLIDLYNMSGTTNLNSSDDSWSAAVNLGHTWNRWGYSWDQARMSTNGCLGLLGRSGRDRGYFHVQPQTSHPQRRFSRREIEAIGWQTIVGHA